MKENSKDQCEVVSTWIRNDVKIVRRQNVETECEVIEKFDDFSGEHIELEIIPWGLTSGYAAHIRFLEAILDEIGEFERIKW